MNNLNKEKYQIPKEKCRDSFVILVIFIMLATSSMLKTPESVTEKIKHI